MSNPDINTVLKLDLDVLRKAEHYRVGDKIYVRVGNGDGDPLKVTVVSDTAGESLNDYSEANSLASLATAEVLSYTVPVGKLLIISNLAFSGNCIGKYTLEIDTITQGIKRTHYTKYDDVFLFEGHKATAGQVIKLKVQNRSKGAGNFNGNLLGRLQNA